MEVIAGAASQLLVQTTNNGVFLPLLRVIDVSYVGLLGQSVLIMVLVDNRHFVIAYLTPLARQQLSTTNPRRVRTNSIIRLVEWETVSRQGQPVVFVSALIIYAQPVDAEEQAACAAISMMESLIWYKIP
eukprot:16034555-Heterocapsa_arctica.AAC.1